MNTNRSLLLNLTIFAIMSGTLGLLMYARGSDTFAQEHISPSEHKPRAESDGDGPSAADHTHHDSMKGIENPNSLGNVQSQAAGLLMEGHHHHRPAMLPPDEDKAYSEFNHHIAGVFVLFAGGMALLAAVGGSRYAWARYSWPLLFFLLGIFLMVRHDPESWPWGPLTFAESVTDAQVLQHMLFTFIVLIIGGIEWLRCRRTLTHPAWGWIFPSLAVSAAVMLFMHKHGEGLVADKIYRHHSIMAVSGIIAMIAKVFDDSQIFKSQLSNYVWTTLIMFVGFMLLIYTE
jgi:hypothetical protein